MFSIPEFQGSKTLCTAAWIRKWQDHFQDANCLAQASHCFSEARPCIESPWVASWDPMLLIQHPMRIPVRIPMDSNGFQRIPIAVWMPRVGGHRQLSLFQVYLAHPAEVFAGSQVGQVGLAACWGIQAKDLANVEESDYHTTTIIQPKTDMEWNLGLQMFVCNTCW